MSLFDKIIEDHDEAIDNCLASFDFSHLYEDFFKWHNGILNAIEDYKKTKDVASLTNAFQSCAISAAETKENHEPNIEQTSDEPETRRRTRRGAAQKASMALLTNTTAKVKKEKMSLVPEDSAAALDVQVKTEGEEMPAPKRPPPKTKRTAAKKTMKKEHEEITRPSDVILCQADISTVNLLAEPDEEVQTTRVTRTKTRKLKETQEKRNRDTSANDEHEEVNKKKSKIDVNQTTDTTFYDAQNEIVNATVVVDKNALPPQIADDLMTDDESDYTPISGKNAAKTALQMTAAQMCSPSSVKLKIQQFETMQKSNKKPSTPLHNNTYIPRAIGSSAKKAASGAGLSRNLSLSKSGVKDFKALDERRREKEEAAKRREANRQAEIEEKRRKREERELKVHQQRVALENEKKKQLEAQLQKEEDRRKQIATEQREKKQQQKDEAERKKLLAKQKLAEERRAEEERLKAEEANKKAEELHAAKKSASKDKSDRPLYMRTKAPLLPTADCYDSDDEENQAKAADTTRIVHKAVSWDSSAELRQMLLNMDRVKQQLKNSFFVRQTTTPDLIDVFEKISERKLQRSSSAMWVKPPRYTMIHNLDDYLEDDYL